MYHYLMNVLCFQFRVLSIEYFLDKCTLWEIDDYIDYIPYLDRNLWESARLGAFIDAKSHFKGISQYNDICEFKWETEQIEKVTDKEISNEDIARLKQIAKQWEKD